MKWAHISYYIKDIKEETIFHALCLASQKIVMMFSCCFFIVKNSFHYRIFHVLVYIWMRLLMHTSFFQVNVFNIVERIFYKVKQKYYSTIDWQNFGKIPSALPKFLDFWEFGMSFTNNKPQPVVPSNRDLDFSIWFLFSNDTLIFNSDIEIAFWFSNCILISS